MKVRLKITLCMLALLSLLFGLGGSVLISLSFQAFMEQEKESAFRSWEMIFQTLQIAGEWNTEYNYDTIDRVLEQLDQASSPNWLAFRLTSEGGYVYESDQATQYIGAADEPIEPGTATFHYPDSMDSEHYLLVNGTVSVTGDTLTLCTAHNISGPYTMRQTQQSIYWKVFAVLVLLCGLLSYAVSRWITAPLERLSRASRAIASGDFSSRVELRSQDEIGAVAEDFDAMAVQMERTVEQLRQSVQQRERFMGSFAHELKTPMTSIIGYAELLREDILTKDECLDAANYLVSEGKRLEGLSHKLLALFGLKREKLSFMPVSPANLIYEMTEQLWPIYRQQKIHFVCRCQDGTCYLERTLVRSLLLNLFDNAKKAMEQGGTITVEQEMLEDGCRILIQDEGRGIPPEALPHLTEAFYRVDKARSREQGGTGLGLALCQEIVELHHGTIRFSNREDRGACVTVELRGGRACTEQETS